MNKCRSCGRMLKADEQGKDFCKHCVDENGSLKSYEQVSENLAKYLRETQGLDERASANAAKAIVSSQPVWEKKQGVYFEGDMKRKRNTIVTLVVVFALILTGVGIGVFVFDKPEEQLAESKLFDKENPLVINKTVGHNTYMLDLPGYQSNPSVINLANEGSDKKNDAIIFASYVRPQKTDRQIEPEDEYKLLRVKISDEGSKGKGVILKTEKLVSDRYEKNSRFFFLRTKNSEESVYTYDSLFNNQRYGENSAPFKWEPVTKPYHPQYSVLDEHMNEDTYYQVNDEYIMWCEFDKKSSSQSLYLRNFDTLRTIEISKTVAPYTKPLLLANHIVWEDNREISSKSCAIYSYNISSDSEKLLHHSDKNVALLKSKNPSFILFVTYADDIRSYGNPDYTLNIYNLIKSKVEYSFNDEIRIGETGLGNYSRHLPKVCISENPKNPIVTWGIMKKYEGGYCFGKGRKLVDDS